VSLEPQPPDTQSRGVAAFTMLGVAGIVGTLVQRDRFLLQTASAVTFALEEGENFTHTDTATPDSYGRASAGEMRQWSRILSARRGHEEFLIT
jgi:hypothetical protein